MTASSNDTLGALVFETEPAIRVGGWTLAERAALLAHRAGCSPIGVGGRPLDPASEARLRSRGVEVVPASGDTPVGACAGPGGLVVIAASVLFEPAVLAGVIDRRRRDDAAGTAITGGDGTPLLLVLPPMAVAAARAGRTIEAIVDGLAGRSVIHSTPIGPAFCRRVDAAGADRVERDYIRCLNGKNESYFTKKIRRFSVPLTSRLVRLGARPNHVTVGGLLLGLAAAWSVSRGHYGAGVLGAALYYVSMVLDCSDGEVARLTVQDGPFGAWFETVVDYTTYFLLLPALVLASRHRAWAEAYRLAALIAVVGSVVVAIVASYLRHRVAADDPGQFDDASAQALATASRVHRFARWGRQWIKRSAIAHLIVALALVDQLPALLFLWAFGATLAAVVIVAVEPFVIRRVHVRAPNGA